MKPAPFNGAPPKTKARRQKPYHPLLGEDGLPIFPHPPERVRVARYDHPDDARECPERPPIIGRCWECGARRPDRVGGICPGACDPGGPTLPHEYAEDGAEP